MHTARENVTVIIPFQRGSNEEWLRVAVGSLPKDQRYLLLENDGELADALNEGLRQADTEFVFRLDADDFIEPGALDFLVSLAWDADVTYPTFRFVDQDLAQIGEYKAAPFCPNRLLQSNYIPGTSLFRPEKALQVGGYREMPVGEDWDLWVRMSRAGARFKGVQEAVYDYRKHSAGRNTVSAERFGEVKDDLYQQVVGERPTLAASFYHQATLAQTYHRCLLPARFLPGQALDFPLAELLTEDSFAFPQHQGTAVYQFPGDVARAVMMCEMRESGIRVLIEADDSYFEAGPYDNGWEENVNSEGKPSRAWFRKCLQEFSDGVVVTTDHLAQRYSKLNPNVFVCPNQIDPADWPQPNKPDDGITRIGWFASPSHSRDATLIRPALEWASRQPGVEVIIIGLDPGWKFKRLQIPWSNDMGVYRQLVGMLDIGLAPVVETPWAKCRSDLKALEYAIAGVCPVLSDTVPYLPYEGACYRAKGAKDFTNIVKQLIANPSETSQMAIEARTHVLEKRTVEQNIHLWRQAIE